MHNPASVQENDTHKFLWDFVKQSDHQILDRRPDLIIIITADVKNSQGVNNNNDNNNVLDIEIQKDNLISARQQEKESMPN